MITNEIIVHGLVQGVGFRWTTRILAQDLGVTGSVENLSNGDVKIIAQADLDTMATFLKLVEGSPSPSGRVDKMDVTPLDVKEKLHSFRVTG